MQCTNRQIHVLPAHDVRRQKTQDGFAGAVDQDAPLQHLGDDLLGQVGGVHFHGQHQAHAAHVDDALVFCRQVMQLLLEVGAGLLDVGEQILLLDGVDDSDGYRASQRAAAEGGSMQAGMDGARRLLGAEHGSQRKAACQRLGQCGYIRLNAKLLVGTPLASAAQAGLNFIRDEQRTGGLRQLARGGKKFLRDGPDAALALNRLRSVWRRPRWRSWPADDPHR